MGSTVTSAAFKRSGQQTVVPSSVTFH